MERHHMRVCRPLGRIQFTFLKCCTFVRLSHCELCLRKYDARELAEEFSAPPLHQFSQSRLMISKVEERRRCCVFLSLEQHRCPRQQQQECSNCSIPAARRQLVEA